MTAFRQATLSRVWLDPATMHSYP